MAVEPTLAEQLRSPWPWHRWLGIVAAVVLVWAGATGILLNHAEDLGLRHEPVTVVWILDLFGVPEPELELGYHAPLGWIAASGDRAFLDAQALPAQLGDLAGVLVGEGGTVIAGSDALVLLDAGGMLLELLPPDADPALGPLTALAPEPLPDAPRAAIARAARGTALDWEQVLRVLHGSHAMGRWGRSLADLTGLALIVLSLTGIVMFVQRRRRHAAHDGAGEDGAEDG